MDMVNRSAIVVRPAQPFLDWLHRVDPTRAQLTLGDLRREPTIYLLPEWETEGEALEHLAEVSSEIFKEQLNGWYRVPSVWPEDADVADQRIDPQPLHGTLLLLAALAGANGWHDSFCAGRKPEADSGWLAKGKLPPG